MTARLKSLSPPWFVIVGAVFFLIAEGFMQWVESRMGVGFFHVEVRLGLVILYFLAAFYGVSRAATSHPFFDPAYQDWLSLTPWTVAKPLPLGPIELGVRDAVVLGLLIALNLISPQRDSMRLLCIFLMVHCAILTIANWWTAESAYVYLAMFGMGLMVRLWGHPWVCLGTGAAVYLVVHEGVWQGLRAFPWKQSKVLVLSPEVAIRDRGDKPKIPCGWPYDRLLRDPVAKTGSPETGLDALVWCLLLGWWISCLASRLSTRNEAVMVAFLSAAAVFTISNLWRLLLYVQGYDTPLGPIGRIATGRLIIPGFDVVWVAHLLMVLGAGSTSIGLMSWGVPGEIVGPVVAALIAFIALRTPPGLRRWRLTGGHRMRHVPTADMTGVGSSK